MAKAAPEPTALPVCRTPNCRGRPRAAPREFRTCERSAQSTADNLRRWRLPPDLNSPPGISCSESRDESCVAWVAVEPKEDSLHIVLHIDDSSQAYPFRRHSAYEWHRQGVGKALPTHGLIQWSRPKLAATREAAFSRPSLPPALCPAQTPCATPARRVRDTSRR